MITAADLAQLDADLAAIKLRLTPATVHFETAVMLLTQVHGQAADIAQTRAALVLMDASLAENVTKLQQELQQLRDVLVPPPVVPPVDPPQPPDPPSPTVPDSPTGLVATAGDSGVFMSWDVSPRATTYLVLRRQTRTELFALRTVVSIAMFTDIDVKNGLTYEYQIIASNIQGGSGPSSPVSATPTAPPTPPTNGTRRISLTDLVHEGQFMLPGGQIGASTFDYGGRAISYERLRHSLFVDKDPSHLHF